MNLQSAFALGIAALVALPLVAHRLRKREPRSVPFAPTRFVPAAKVPTQRRRALEDKPLFAARAAAIAALALLGATPFARCDAVTLGRHGGASIAVAIVVDDSASMQAPAPGSGDSRFAKAHAAATTLLGELREGDAVYLVTASRPPRVVSGGDPSSARDVLAHLGAAENGGPPRASDGPSDLPSALALAQGLVADAPQLDRRVVLLSDLCDGASQPLPFGAAHANDPKSESSNDEHVSYMFPLPELVAPFDDCGILSADLRGDRVVVAVACSRGTLAAKRGVDLVDGATGKVLGGAPIVAEDRATEAKQFVVTIPLSDSGGSPVPLAGARTDRALLRADTTTGTLVARLRADRGAIADAVPSNDTAPLLAALSEPAIAVVVAQDETGPTATKPLILQAFAALEPDGLPAAPVAIRPLPSIPDRVEDLAPFRGVVLDDPPGLSPEQRRALSAFVEGGGVLFLGLGPNAARGRLGQTFEPWFTRPLAWSASPVPGIATGVVTDPVEADKTTENRWFSIDRSGLEKLAPQGRVTLDPDDARRLSAIARWSDNEPLVATRNVGAGELFVTTLPFSPATSDFPLRPAFLDVLQGVVDATVGHSAPRRTIAGTRWSLPSEVVAVHGPAQGTSAGPLVEVVSAGSDTDAAGPEVAPRLIGAYAVATRAANCTQKDCEREERRVVAPSVDEIGPTPRPLPKGVSLAARDDSRVATDVSWMVALVVLGLVATELLLRVFGRRAVAPASEPVAES